MVGEEQTLHHLLCTVLTNTYEDATPYLDFTVSIVPKELKSRQAQYVPNDRKIELFTLTQSPEATVLTLLRELTRHVLFMDEGELKQKDVFF
ncbi:hypothetical protein [Enterococcus sp. AZ050]